MNEESLKESLNEIKQMDWENLKPSQIVAINYLIERVQELEDKLARIRFVNNDYDKQNKRYREAIIEALHGLKTLPSVAPRLYLISILDKALEGEE